MTKFLPSVNPFLVVLNIVGTILVFYGLRKYTDSMPIRVRNQMAIWVLFDLFISVSLVGICGMTNFYSFRPVDNIYVILVVEFSYVAYIVYMSKMAIKLMNRQDEFKERLQIGRRDGMTGTTVAAELCPTLDNEYKYIIVQILVTIGTVIMNVPIIFDYLKYFLT